MKAKIVIRRARELSKLGLYTCPSPYMYNIHDEASWKWATTKMPLASATTHATLSGTTRQSWRRTCLWIKSPSTCIITTPTTWMNSLEWAPSSSRPSSPLHSLNPGFCSQTPTETTSRATSKYNIKTKTRHPSMLPYSTQWPPYESVYWALQPPWRDPLNGWGHSRNQACTCNTESKPNNYAQIYPSSRSGTMPSRLK